MELGWLIFSMILPLYVQGIGFTYQYVKKKVTEFSISPWDSFDTFICSVLSLQWPIFLVVVYLHPPKVSK